MQNTFKEELKAIAINCTCGHNYARNQHNDNPLLEGEDQQHHSTSCDPQQKQNVCGDTTSLPLDTSFVQIPMMHTFPTNQNAQLRNPNRIPQKTNRQGSAGPAEDEQHVSSEQACGGSSSTCNFTYSECLKKLYQTVSSTTDSVPSLCQTCVQRVKKTLMADTERLLAESLMYEKAIRDDAAYRRGWKQMMFRATTFDSDRPERPTCAVSEASDGSILNAEHNIEEIYLREIELLEQACREQRNELTQLRALQKEQVFVCEELQQFSEALAAEENALELEAKAFDNDQEQLSRMLGEVNNEIDRLTSSEIRLPALLVQLHIDVERGLRYPLINELRLAYRPKGDVHQMEIQAAWALAAYLLLVVTTMFQFQSQNWKIVPLSHCAKLIFCPPTSAVNIHNKNEKNRIVVFNLGHPKTNGSKALLAWNALLCQVTEHVKHKTNDAIQYGILNVLEIPQMPFEISPNSIGGVQLRQLDENDDSGWSRVIHFMASNLQWLSKCASIYVLHQVVLLTPFQEVEAKAALDK